MITCSEGRFVPKQKCGGHMPRSPVHRDVRAYIFEDVQPLTTKPFHWPANGSYLFPAETKKAQQPWMARQSVSLAVSRIRNVMFALIGRRRWNQEFIWVRLLEGLQRG